MKRERGKIVTKQKKLERECKQGRTRRSTGGKKAYRTERNLIKTAKKYTKKSSLLITITMSRKIFQSFELQTRSKTKNSSNISKVHSATKFSEHGLFL